MNQFSINIKYVERQEFLYNFYVITYNIQIKYLIHLTFYSQRFEFLFADWVSFNPDQS